MNSNIKKTRARMERPGPTRLPPPVAVAASARVDEVGDALRAEIGRCGTRAVEQALLLDSVGAQAYQLTCEIYPDVVAGELRRRSHAIRGLVAHAHGVLAELQCVAGRLDALAVLRAAERATESEIDDGSC